MDNNKSLPLQWQFFNSNKMNRFMDLRTYKGWCI